MYADSPIAGVRYVIWSFFFFISKKIIREKEVFENAQLPSSNDINILIVCLRFPSQ